MSTAGEFAAWVDAVLREPEPYPALGPAASDLDQVTGTWSVRGKQETWDNCPEAFRQRYVLCRKAPASLEMVQGRVVHGVAQAVLEARVQGKSEPDPAEVAKSLYDQAKYEIEVWPLHPAQAEAETIMYARLLAEELLPRHPVQVESRFEVDLGFTRLVGVIDYIDDRGVVGDFKVAGPSRDLEHEAHHGMQLSVYSLAYRRMTGEAPTALRLDVLAKGHPPRTFSIITERTESQERAALYTIEQTIKSVRTGIFPPNTHGRNCHPDRCPFWGVCPARGQPFISTP